MIALLPQGTLMSGFAPSASAPFDIPAFISEALDALVSAGVLAEKPPVSGVILSGHSGGGGALSVLLAQAGNPHVPAVVEAEFLFEGINGPNELATQTAFVTAKLNADLAAVTGATDASAALAYLARSFRFAGFYDSQFYVPFYTQLKTSIAAWFAKNAGAFGGTSDPTYVTRCVRTTRSRYRHRRSRTTRWSTTATCSRRSRCCRDGALRGGLLRRGELARHAAVEVAFDGGDDVFDADHVHAPRQCADRIDAPVARIVFVRTVAESAGEPCAFQHPRCRSTAAPRRCG